ncbi:arylesterase [Leptospira perolatii]|uniref:Arylesterase n=1 Tax=Leptospira perolatii TaxID=2023191 RepID=A0A2M9ZS81_9LEPT|nr:arylesterase [Leptospira perolatii]PJZ71351.1 arylesterase [Leptospira perolatii]PJZ74885.1 arylesterase [Leptospira perolatii]
MASRVIVRICLFLLLFLASCAGEVKKISLSQCSKFPGMPGPEDLDIDRSAGILYVSSHERRTPDQDGFLFVIDLKSPNPQPIRIETNYPKSFRPHGISLLNKNGKYRLFVISHPIMFKEHAIEVFERTEVPSAKSKTGVWKHIRTLKDPLLTSPNDLFVRAEDEIFVSNDHGSGGVMRYLFDDAFNIDRGPIAYFDGKTWSSLGNELNYGNGILSVKRSDGSEFLYRSGFTDRGVYKFPILRESGKLTLGEPKLISLDSGTDNLIEDEDGKVIVVTHKSTWKFLRQMRDPNYPSPTQVFVINPDDSFNEIYADTGEEISAGSTALTYAGKLYIAQVFNDFVLGCNLPKK